MPVDYSNTDYLNSVHVDNIMECFPRFSGNSVRLWAVNFVASYVFDLSNTEWVADFVCGKSGLTVYLNKYFKVTGFDNGRDNFHKVDRNGFEYEGIPVVLGDCRNVRLPGRHFDCSYMIDAWWWVKKNPKKAADYYSKISKDEADWTQKEYERILREMCRVTNRRVIVVDKESIELKGGSGRYGWGKASTIKLLEDEGFEVGWDGIKCSSPNVVDQVLAVSQREEKNYTRIAYYGVGIVADRREDSI